MTLREMIIKVCYHEFGSEHIRKANELVAWKVQSNNSGNWIPPTNMKDL
jgi:hypothetical protein